VKGQHDNAHELGIERPDEPQRNQESLTKIGHAAPRFRAIEQRVRSISNSCLIVTAGNVTNGRARRGRE
jgi:hypothetical protein